MATRGESYCTATDQGALLMAEIRRAPIDMVVYPIIYRVSYISGGVSKNNGQAGVSKN